MENRNESGTEKGTMFLTMTMLKTQNAALTHTLNLLNTTLTNFSKPTQQKKDFIRKEDKDAKLYKALDGVEPSLNKLIKLQESEKKKKNDGLLSLFGGLAKFAAGGLMAGGLIGFLLTGKQEFLFSIIKGFKKFFFDIPAMMGNSAKKMFGIFDKGVNNVTKASKMLEKSGKALSKADKLLDKAEKVGKAAKAAKSFGKAVKLTGKSGKLIGEAGKLTGKAGKLIGEAGKLAAKATGKAAAKKIPVIGSLLALWFSIERFRKGDVVGGLLEIGSGLAGFLHLMPGVGTGAAIGIQLLIDGIILTRDLVKIKGGGKEATPKAPKKSSKTDWRKIPVIGSFLDIFEGFKMMFSGAPVAGIKTSLLGLNTFGIPGMDWVISKTLFPMVDCAAWLIKETPAFFGKVGNKIGSIATSGFEEIKKMPIVGGIITAVDSIINFAKDPKAGVISIANMMNDFIPGSGDLLITAGKMVFGAADWIMSKAGAVGKWGKETFNKINEAASTSSDSIRQNLRTDAKAEAAANAPVASAAKVPKEKGEGMFGWFNKKKNEAVNAAVSGSEASVINSAKFLAEQQSGGQFDASSFSSSKQFLNNDEIRQLAEMGHQQYPNVSVDTIAGVIKTESAGNVFATNPNSSAKGLMQIIDGTAKDLGLKNPFDPVQNVMAGSKYLSQLSDKYKGNQAKAVVAYFKGPGVVDKINDISEIRGDLGGTTASEYYKRVVKKGGTTGGSVGKQNNTEVASPSQNGSANLPTASIPSFTPVASMQKMELGESTIQALAVAMGSSFRGAMPTTRSNMISIDNGSMRG